MKLQTKQIPSLPQSNTTSEKRKMANLDRINELIGEKDFDKAQELIEPALKEEPDNIELLKLAGLTAVNQGNYDKARIAFETVVKYNPEDATSFFYLGSCYDNLGDLVSAKMLT